MLKRRICGLLLLCVCFNSLNFAVIGNRLRDKLGVTTEENLRNSREFLFFKSVQAATLGQNKKTKKQTTKTDDGETKDTEDKFDAKDYSDAYKKAVEDIYDQFEKAYRRNQEIINRSSGLINQTGYQRLLDQQVKSENLFTKAFKSAKITKNGDELVFPEFESEEVNKAVAILQKWIIEKNETYDFLKGIETM